MTPEELEEITALSGAQDIVDESGNPLPPGPGVLDDPPAAPRFATLDGHPYEVLSIDHDRDLIRLRDPRDGTTIIVRLSLVTFDR